MRILLTNDDGIHAPGICAIYYALKDEHEVVVVAPESERSAVGHAITLADPLRVRRICMGGFIGWAVNGTPADCVKLGLAELAGGEVDAVISGINQGANVGINILYSGTVSAATEAVIMGTAGIAVSLDSLTTPDFCFSASLVAANVKLLADLSISLKRAININVPRLPPQEIKGLKVTVQDQRRFVECFEKRTDPRGNIYYWHSPQGFPNGGGEGTDISELKRGYITITPVSHYLSDDTAITNISKVINQLNTFITNGA